MAAANRRKILAQKGKSAAGFTEAEAAEWAHLFIADWREWEWSSYQRILLPNPTHLQKQTILHTFGNIPNYIQYHQDYEQHQVNENFWRIEEEDQ